MMKKRGNEKTDDNKNALVFFATAINIRTMVLLGSLVMMCQIKKYTAFCACLVFVCSQALCSVSAAGEDTSTSAISEAEQGSGSTAEQKPDDNESISDSDASSTKTQEDIVDSGEFKQTSEDEKLEKQAIEEEKSEQQADDRLVDSEEKYSAPLYDKLVPVSGWDRYSCDSASTVSQWLRWWKYLCLEKNETLLMSWIDGLVLKIYPKNEICRALFVKGIYNPNQLVVVNSLLPKGGILVDAGANIGYSLLLASKAIEKKGRIVALEPSKRDFDRLQENVKINKLDDVISVYRYAVSDKKGNADLMVADEERSSLNTLGTEFSVKGVEKLASENVETISIDELVFEKKIDKVDVLELDIEGSEDLALKGAMKTIERDHPAVVLGVNDSALKSCGTSKADIKKILRELKYRVYKIVESPTFALKEVEDIETEHEKVVFCLHESVVPPNLPQPEEKSILCRICGMFR
ncbi:hypothetical protein FACS189449_02980 [Alphaproteobacteria bacterium]|nr:hypothetical protein FACS189449_02980 [Alphaproteobacteria bacterium]